MCVNTASSRFLPNMMWVKHAYIRVLRVKINSAAYCVESDRSRGWYSRSIVLVSAATLDNCGGARV